MINEDISIISYIENVCTLQAMGKMKMKIKQKLYILILWFKVFLILIRSSLSSHWEVFCNITLTLVV